MSTQHWPNPYDGDYMERRVEHPVFFMAGEGVLESQPTCKICGYTILPGEVIAEVEDKFGIQYAHELCIEAALEDLRSEE